MKGSIIRGRMVNPYCSPKSRTAWMTWNDLGGVSVGRAPVRTSSRTRIVSESASICIEASSSGEEGVSALSGMDRKKVLIVSYDTQMNNAKFYLAALR
jgi:hypothetical protein